MPFVTIDWSRFGQSADSQNDPLQQLRYLLHPANITRRILGLDLGYSRSKKRPLCVLYVFHRILMLFMTVFLICITGLALYKACTCQIYQIYALLHTFLMVEGLICFISMLMWSSFKQLAQFETLLSSATTGVAINRHYKALKWITYSISSVLGVLASGWIVYDTITLLFNPPLKWLPNPYNNHSLNLDALNYVMCSVRVYLGVCWTSVHIIAIVIVAVVALELNNTNNDLKEDNNAYQTPVIKHYISIQYNLSKVVKQVDRLISVPIAGVDFVFAVLAIAFIPYSIEDTKSWADFTFLLVLVLTLFMPPVFLLTLEAYIHSIASDFGRIIQSLTSSDNRLDIEMHAVTLSYQMKQMSNPPGFSIATFLLVSKTNLIKMLFIGTVISLQLWIILKQV